MILLMTPIYDTISLKIFFWLEKKHTFRKIKEARENFSYNHFYLNNKIVWEEGKVVNFHKSKEKKRKEDKAKIPTVGVKMSARLRIIC